MMACPGQRAGSVFGTVLAMVTLRTLPQVRGAADGLPVTVRTRGDNPMDLGHVRQSRRRHRYQLVDADVSKPGQPGHIRGTWP
jgi:hypothetical protein